MKLSPTHEMWLRDYVNDNVHVNVSQLVESCIYASDMQSTFKRFEDFDIELWSQYDEETESFKEVFEWWIVSNYFADKLLSRGEIMIYSGNLNIWGRQCTGQSITMDWLIRDMYKQSISGPSKEE